MRGAMQHAAGERKGVVGRPQPGRDSSPAITPHVPVVWLAVVRAVSNVRHALPFVRL